jgi:hypothetical protein
MVRGLLIVMIFLFDFFKPHTGVIYAAVIVGILSFSVAIYATLTISETHDRDLDFTEN